jgi:hypothetical protein
MRLNDILYFWQLDWSWLAFWRDDDPPFMCSDCRWFAEFTHGRAGHCRLHPPAADTNNYDDDRRGRWPIMKAADWCGQGAKASRHVLRDRADSRRWSRDHEARERQRRDEEHARQLQERQRARGAG